MDSPAMFEPVAVARDTYVLPAALPVPGLGVLPVNAFVLRARQPVLIDTGLAALRDDFLNALECVIDPADLRWIWLTHADFDHMGNLAAVLEVAPRARVATTFLGMGKMMLAGLHTDRVELVAPGGGLDVGDRHLACVAPPIFDAPETTAAFDPRTRTLFSADSFGAVMERPEPSAAALFPQALREGQVTWAQIDAPWLGMVGEVAFRRRLDAVRALAPETVLSAHLPPATGMTEALLQNLAAARDAATAAPAEAA